MSAGRPLPFGRQPSEGRAGRRARPAESGLPTGAEDSTSSGQEAQTERRRFRPATVANGSTAGRLAMTRRATAASASAATITVA